MSDIKALDVMLKARGFKHFTAGEIVKPSNRVGNIVNGMPANDLWYNIIPTLRIVEWLRETLGAPIIVNSGWRSVAYNDVVGGSKASLHTRFNALDIRCLTATPKQLKAMLVDAALVPWVGIGLYDSFIHLDTRVLMFGMPASEWYG